MRSALPAVLAIDTSTDACSVAFATGDDCASSHRILPRAHNRHIFSMIDEVLGMRSLSDVDCFACGVGPGSFTGLRIAVSVVQGLAWSLDKPVMGFCSLEAQARSALTREKVTGDWLLSATDAQIGQLYWRLFRIEEGIPVAVGEPQISKPDALVLPDEVSSIAVVGSGVQLREQFTPAVQEQVEQWLPSVRPHAEDMAQWIHSHSSDYSLLSPEQLTPRYVQQDIGWKKLSEQPRRD